MRVFQIGILRHLQRHHGTLFAPHICIVQYRSFRKTQSFLVLTLGKRNVVDSIAFPPQKTVTRCWVLTSKFFISMASFSGHGRNVCASILNVYFSASQRTEPLPTTRRPSMGFGNGSTQIEPLSPCKAYAGLIMTAIRKIPIFRFRLCSWKTSVSKFRRFGNSFASFG